MATPATNTHAENVIRRSREIASAEDDLRDAIAAKALHGWLQNRNQTATPLHVDLARLDAEGRRAIAAFAALCAQAGGESEAARRMRAWLATAGGDNALLGIFDAAIAEPAPLPVLIERVQAPQLASLAFVVALVAAQSAGASGQAFAEYVAARLALPSAVIRTAQRRYRA